MSEAFLLNVNTETIQILLLDVYLRVGIETYVQCFGREASHMSKFRNQVSKAAL